VARRFIRHSGRRQSAQLVIHQWQQLIGGGRIAILSRLDNARDIAHAVTVAATKMKTILNGGSWAVRSTAQQAINCSAFADSVPAGYPGVNPLVTTISSPAMAKCDPTGLWRLAPVGFVKQVLRYQFPINRKYRSDPAMRLGIRTRCAGNVGERAGDGGRGLCVLIL
jgi:hypothetical protein